MAARLFALIAAAGAMAPACAAAPVEHGIGANADDVRLMVVMPRPIDETVEPCGVAMTLDAALVAEAASGADRAYDGAGAAPAMVAGSLWYLRQNQEAGDGVSGSVLFLRDETDDWRAVAPVPDESLMGLYVAEQTGAIAAVTMRAIGEPGPWWTLATSQDGFATARCLLIPAPDALNQPAYRHEFLELADFNIGADGRGALVGSAHVEREGQTTERFWIYETADGGRRWSTPREIEAAPPALEGLFTAVERDEAGAAGLAAALRAAVNAP